MTKWQEFFRGKKITVMGLGLLGRGLGDVKFLASLGAELTVTDLKTAEQLASSLKPLKKFSNIKYVLGEHRLVDFKTADLIIKAAGVPLDSLYVAAALVAGVPVYMSTALFVKFLPAKTTVIGVTGTRGKSTTTQLIYEIVKAAGRRVHLGGNVRGLSTLAQLPKVRSGDVVVLELDSWQLQGFGDLKISPDVAIFTTFYPDHLNYYNNDLDLYFRDKANLFRHQTSEQVLIAGQQFARGPLRQRLLRVNPEVNLVTPRPTDWPDLSALGMIGEHNRHNATLAILAARQLGIKAEVITKTVKKFTGVPGRLELVRVVKKVSWYNDTTSTTPEALVAALEALGQKFGQKKITLIMGGADKKLDFKKARQAWQKYCRQIILLPGSGTERLRQAKLISGQPVSSMKAAVLEGRALARPGEVVVLSPGFASFGPPPGGFKNEFDRGDQFNRAVKLL